jgi:hypothetical protein
LAQFEQDAVGAAGVNKGHHEPPAPGCGASLSRLLALARKLFHRRRDVVHLYADIGGDPRRAFRWIGHRRLGAERFKQLDLGSASGRKATFTPVRLSASICAALAQPFGIELGRLFDARHRDADMVYFHG